ncbi:MAG: MTH938/NDUFAF3 family protein [Xanthomonadales bacterium]
MELTLHKPEDHLFVRSVSASGFRIGDDVYEGPVIVSANEVIADWAVGSITELTEALLEPVFRLEPEIVLLGTGPTQAFIEPALTVCFFRRGIGIEAMTTEAACRTFNVLMSERRNAVAAMLPLSAN